MEWRYEIKKGTVVFINDRLGCSLEPPFVVPYNQTQKFGKRILRVLHRTGKFPDMCKRSYKEV